MNRYILICGTLLLLHTQAKAWVGGDVIRAGMFYTYAKQAKQTLIAQDAAMTLNLSGHIHYQDIGHKTPKSQRTKMRPPLHFTLFTPLGHTYFLAP